MVKSQEDILKVIILSTITAVVVGGFVIWKQRQRIKRAYQFPIPSKWRKVGEISKINVYPLKSGKYKPLNTAVCTKLGIRQEDTPGKLSLSDRSFVVYNEDTNEKVTIRNIPKMLLIDIKVLDEDTVTFSSPGVDDLVVKIPSSTNSKKDEMFIIMWFNEKIYTLDCGEDASNWFTKTLVADGNTRFRLGYFARDVLPPRSVKVTRAHQMEAYTKMDDDYLGMYSDLSSYMIMTDTSMDELNSRLEKPVTEVSFRPNIMVKGTKKPFEEDDWDWVKLGDDTVLRNFKKCTRCTLTTTDPKTGIKDPQLEPLKTLRSYRLTKDPSLKKLEGQSPLMGINMGLHTTGVIRIGDPVYINCDQ